MSDTKTDLLAEFDAARATLNAALDSIDPDFEIYPGWKKREFMAHIAGWEAMCYEAFRAYLAGVTSRSYPFSSIDAANEYFVSTRQCKPLEDVATEYEINHFAVRNFLNDIPIEAYDQPVKFLWYQETVAQFIRGAVKHERNHADDIRLIHQSERST